MNRLLQSLGLRWLLLLILVPGVAALVYTTLNTQSIQRMSAEQDLLARVRAMSQIVDDHVLRAQHALELMASASPPQPGRPIEEYYETLVRARKAMPYVDGLILFDANGNGVLSAEHPLSTQFPSLGARERVLAIAAGAMPGVGDVIYGNLSRRGVVTIDVPIRENGKVVYVLNAALESKRFVELLGSQAMPEEAIYALFDAKGVVAARTRSAEEMVGKSVTPFVRALIDSGRREGVGLGHSMEGIHQVAAMYRSSVTGYGVVAGVPKAVVEAPVRAALIANASALTASLVLGLFLVWLFGAKLRSDIKKLEMATKAVAHGQTDVDFSKSGTAELAQLGKHFEAMVKSLKTYQSELEHSLTHDLLTGLGNRALLADHLSTEVARAQRSDTVTALLLLDLDRFALVNDSLSHNVGDEVLREVARRLRETVRPSDFVARLGGDEFVIVAADLGTEAEAASLAFRVLRAIQTPLAVGGQNLNITGSLGISVAPRDGTTGETLLINADSAMFRAKENGSNQFQFFAAEMNKKIQGRMSTEAGLRKALDEGQLVLHYQPRVDLRTGKVAGVEALVRWRHPERGLVHPAEFIPVAEESGLIAPLGRWVLERACHDAKRWCEMGHHLIVGVNVSVRQFQYGDLANVIDATLRKTGLAPKFLELELTESAIMVDPSRTLRLLGELKRTGVRVALDDFGTGYSSLAHLKRLPVDVLKIDQSFVRDIADGADGEVLVKTIISLGHSLRQEVIAEGVENQAQADCLHEMGCDLAQGYLFSPPLPLSELLDALRAQSPLAGVGSGAFQRSNLG